MTQIPDLATFTPKGQKVKVLRPSVGGGEDKYGRIPIRRRQLKYEVENFINWILHLIEHEQEFIKQQPDYPPYFAAGQASVLILACDRGELVQAEIGTIEQIRRLKQEVILDDPTEEDRAPVENLSDQQEAAVLDFSDIPENERLF